MGVHVYNRIYIYIIYIRIIHIYIYVIMYNIHIVCIYIYICTYMCIFEVELVWLGPT